MEYCSPSSFWSLNDGEENHQLLLFYDWALTDYGCDLGTRCHCLDKSSHL